MNTERELAEVLALLEMATPVDWEMCDRGFGDADIWPAEHDARKYYDIDLVRGTLRLEDANAICAAINFIRKHGPALLSRADGGEARDAARYRWLREHDNADLMAEDVIDDAIAIAAMAKERGE